MLLSKATEYGFRAVLYLATRPSEGYVSIREMSEELEISFHFLTKILQKLTQAGVLRSYRGPAGGVALAKPPEVIALLDIVLAIDGSELFTECVLGLPGCGDQRPCPFHERWAVERERLYTMFSETSVAEMAGEIEEKGLRLKSVPWPPES